ncbi:MAG TPA: GNAT family N-acetyltransferase [Pseudonocardia sp.]|uniref:GNAT family N-acetyltransferase n=1 Tax=Pseudonocardia sp. TaxID=60912 RepID=UPI002EDB6EC5
MISSPRLVLRMLTAHDAERMLAGSHPELPVFADGYPSAFATQVLRLVALYPAIDQEVGEGAPDLGPWLLLRRSDDAVIGTISCARTGNPAEMSVGYDITPPCWGEGYATEALGAVVEHLLSLLDISRVCAETVTDHIASRRVMEKSGMRWQRDEVAEHDGREVKLAHYAIDRPEPI